MDELIVVDNQLAVNMVSNPLNSPTATCPESNYEFFRTGNALLLSPAL
jgi:hypothetical protein